MCHICMMLITNLLIIPVLLSSTLSAIVLDTVSRALFRLSVIISGKMILTCLELLNKTIRFLIFRPMSISCGVVPSCRLYPVHGHPFFVPPSSSSSVAVGSGILALAQFESASNVRASGRHSADFIATGSSWLFGHDSHLSSSPNPSQDCLGPANENNPTTMTRRHTWPRFAKWPRLLMTLSTALELTSPGTAEPPVDEPW